MKNSIDVVQDENGYITQSDGRPLVVVFDSKPLESKRPVGLSWQEPVVLKPAERARQIDAKQEEKGPSIQAHEKKRAMQKVKFVERSRLSAACSRTSTHPSMPNVKESQKRHRTLSKDLQSPGRANLNVRSPVVCRKGTGPLEVSSALPTIDVRFPSCTFPVKMEPYMYTLVQRYLGVISRFTKSKSGGNKEDLVIQSWFPMSITDPALFHSILYGSAIYADLHNGKSPSPMASRHMKEAINLLRLRLLDPNLNATDTTIAAVAHLADIETMTGNFENWRLHIDGLYRMVQMRGGIANLDRGLQRKIRSADLNGCAGSLSKPRFPPTDRLCRSRYSQPPSGGVWRLVERHEIDGRLLHIFEALQELTEVLNNNDLTALTLQRLNFTLQYHLLLFQSTSLEHETAQLEEVCCFTILAYLKVLWRFHLFIQTDALLPGGASADQAIIDRLKILLGSMTSETKPAKALYLWSLFIGSAAATGTSKRAWFVARIVKAIVSMQIDSWEDFKSVLVEFFWVERIHGITCKELWEEAMTIKGVLYENDT